MNMLETARNVNFYVKNKLVDGVSDSDMSVRPPKTTYE